MNRTLLITACLLLASITVPLASAGACDRDPITGESPCNWTCDSSIAHGYTCRMLGYVLFPCSSPLAPFLPC